MLFLTLLAATAAAVVFLVSALISDSMPMVAIALAILGGLVALRAMVTAVWQDDRRVVSLARRLVPGYEARIEGLIKSLTQDVRDTVELESLSPPGWEGDIAMLLVPDELGALMCLSFENSNTNSMFEIKPAICVGRASQHWKAQTQDLNPLAKKMFFNAVLRQNPWKDCAPRYSAHTKLIAMERISAYGPLSKPDAT